MSSSRTETIIIKVVVTEVITKTFEAEVTFPADEIPKNDKDLKKYSEQAYKENLLGLPVHQEKPLFSVQAKELCSVPELKELVKHHRAKGDDKYLTLRILAPLAPQGVSVLALIEEEWATEPTN